MPTNAPHTIVAAFGHAWLKDQGFGIRVVETLRARGVPPGVDLADWSFGTITAYQRLIEQRYTRAVFVSAVGRGRRPGTLHRLEADRTLPEPAMIHARVADAAMGLVSVDNLLVLAGYYGQLPPDVVLIEAEPVDETWGAELSAPLASLLDTAVAMVLRETERGAPVRGACHG